MTDYAKNNWVQFLADMRGETSVWKFAASLGKRPYLVSQQRKPLGSAFKLLCDFHDAGFTWDEIGEALERHRKMSEE